MLIRFTALILIVICFFSCKKDSETTGTIYGVWKVDYYNVKSYYNNQLNESENSSGNGGILNFQSDGTLLYSDATGDSGSSTFSLNGNILTVDGESYEIRNLTNSKATLFFRYDMSPGDYIEEYTYLKR